MNEQLAARAEAAAWITRLHGPHRSADMEAGFRQWLEEREENRIEFEALTDIWTSVGSLPDSSAPGLERFEEWTDSQPLPASHVRGHRLRAWRFAAAAAMVAIVLVLAWPLLRQTEPVLATSIGETRMLQLADKSRVWMNSDTRLRILFDEGQRRAELIRGEALFEVAKDARRPFVVEAGGRYVTALGTAFVVRHEPDRTSVTMVEGKVAVSPSPAIENDAPVLENALHGGSPAPHDGHRVTGPSPWILSAGQRLTLTSGGAPTLDEPPVESVLAWRGGEVILDETPLQQAVAELNRYDTKAIVIEGPAIAELSVSGRYQTGDNEGFARAIAKLYRLDLQEREGRIYLKSR